MKFALVASIYPARQMEEKATESLQNDRQQKLAGVGSAARKTGTVLKLVSSEIHRGTPFQGQALVDSLDQKSAENGQKNHSLTISGAAEFSASVGVDVEQIVVVTDEAAAETVADDETVRDSLAVSLRLGNSFFQIDQLIETLYV